MASECGCLWRSGVADDRADREPVRPVACGLDDARALLPSRTNYGDQHVRPIPSSVRTRIAEGRADDAVDAVRATLQEVVRVLARCTGRDQLDVVRASISGRFDASNEVGEPQATFPGRKAGP